LLLLKDAHAYVLVPTDNSPRELSAEKDRSIRSRSRRSGHVATGRTMSDRARRRYESDAVARETTRAARRRRRRRRRRRERRDARDDGATARRDRARARGDVGGAAS
jgi:hypothetical protein